MATNPPSPPSVFDRLYLLARATVRRPPVLQLSRGGRLAGRLIDAATGEPTSGMITLIDVQEWRL